MCHSRTHISWWLLKMPPLLPCTWSRDLCFGFWIWLRLISDGLVSYKLIHISILTCINPIISDCRDTEEKILNGYIPKNLIVSLVGKMKHKRAWKQLQNSISTWLNKGASGWIGGPAKAEVVRERKMISLSGEIYSTYYFKSNVFCDVHTLNTTISQSALFMYMYVYS